MLEVGTKAPDFELPDQNEEMHKLSDYAGKKVILYFYTTKAASATQKLLCFLYGIFILLNPSIRVSA